MTEKELRRKIAETAVSFLGAKKGGALHRDIVDTYNSHRPLPRRNGKEYRLTYNDNWCAGFVSAIAIKNGLTDIMPVECSCAEMIKLYQALGRWAENDAYHPQVGDLVFYYWKDPTSHAGDQKNAPNHVGMVTEVHEQGFTVTEGNMGSASVVGQRLVEYDGRYIRGFACPDYRSKAEAENRPWYAETMEWGKAIGLIREDRPTEGITRAEVVQMFRNYDKYREET